MILTHTAPPAWRQKRAAPASTSTSAPGAAAPVLPRDRSIWPGMLIIVGIPTILFAIEYATGVISV